MNLLKSINSDFEKILEKTDPVGQYAFLAEEMVKKDMQMFGKPFPTFLKPYFIVNEHRPNIAKVTESIVRGLEKVEKAFMEGYDFEGPVLSCGLR